MVPTDEGKEGCDMESEFQDSPKLLPCGTGRDIASDTQIQAWTQQALEDGHPIKYVTFSSLINPSIKLTYEDEEGYITELTVSTAEFDIGRGKRIQVFQLLSRRCVKVIRRRFLFDTAA